MSVDIYPMESPRISFSYDLNQKEDIPTTQQLIRSDTSLLDPTFDFDFSTSQNFPFDLSSADEIFSNGIILPANIKETKPRRTNSTQYHNSPEQNIPTTTTTTTTTAVVLVQEIRKKKIMRLKEFLSCSTDTEDDEKPSSTKSSFWQFRRSSSLNNVGNLIRPLQFLSRSKSTGSAPNPKLPTRKQNQSKRSAAAATVMFSRSSSCNSYYPYNNQKRPLPASLKKSYSRSYDNGIRVSPVLHISHACIAKGTASFFGLAAFFCTGKSRTKRKSFIP
ncbi:uncharacterized protein LOC124910596 [Impatiens glandulifera]|uniref:uncharacterized protein LOC124910596 n=1 Tax=Impatiens glandulifera TaxID=253017 RepID=UPI001FB19C1E|nr:uncharacterized protein LOC124910596 [Impatiens glandulifera]